MSSLRERVEGLVASWRKRLNKCIGYPTCDGDLPGEEHSKECPEYGRIYEPINVKKCITDLAAALAAEGQEPDKPFCFYNQEEDAIFMDGEKFVRAAAPSLHKEGGYQLKVTQGVSTPGQSRRVESE